MKVIERILNILKTLFNNNKKLCATRGIVVSVFAFLVLNVYASMLSSVALEQEARCGIVEHIHTDECYKNDILRCEETAHVHDANCYIVLLEENDINELLTEIDNSEERSLESVITDTVDTAMVTISLNESNAEEQAEESGEDEQKLSETKNEESVVTTTQETQEIQETTEENVEEHLTEETSNSDEQAGEASKTVPIEEPNETSDIVSTEETEPAVTEDQIETSDEQFSLDKETIVELNKTIAEDETIPDLVLNENINTTDDAETLSDEYNLNDTSVSNEISLLSVGDEPETGNYNANFYIYLDGSWQCIGTLDFSVARSGWSYAATVSTSDALELINSSLGTSLTRNDISLYYATTENA